MKFNLSDWALRHRSFVWFLMILSMIAGAFSYMNLGREEDPSFTIKTAVISAALPGASIDETMTQVTDRIERKLQDLDGLDYTRSVTYPGSSVVYVELKPEIRGEAVENAWRDMRNMMNDIRGEFPSEFAGFAFNDKFGDVFGSIYAFTSDGFTPREMRDRIDVIRDQVQSLNGSGKVELIGVQEEKIFVEFSTTRLAAFGLDQHQIMAVLQEQNAIVPSGIITAGDERIFVRTGGQYSSAEDVANTSLRIGDRLFKLSDVATVRAGYADPAESLFRYKGVPALGLTIGMAEGGNIQSFGKELDDLMQEVAASLPYGIDMHRIADQPHVVEHAINHFLQALIEAIVIVLAVSFISLGVRAGLVVSLSIPLVLALTFVVMDLLGITLQRISLGALIIALGLLVDDAMIAIETMVSRLELGESLPKAASYAWTSIAFPMLTGTLITVAGFIPIGLNSSMAGEYTFSLFVVIAVSLILSWFVAVLFAPLLGVTMLPQQMKHHEDAGPGRIRRAFQSMLLFSMRARWLVIAATVMCFVAALFGMSKIEQQFFPTSDRTELIVDVTLPQNASIHATDRVVAALDSYLAEQPEAQFWSSYVGTSTPRFMLTVDTPTPGPHFGQIVVQTPDLAARDSLRDKLDTFAKTVPEGEIYVKLLEVGPPVGKPVQYRLSGPDIDVLRDKARVLSAILASDNRLTHISSDWSEPARVARINFNQEKLRQLGLSQKDIASSLQTIFTGAPLTALRDDTYLVDLVARGSDADRSSLEALMNLQFSAHNGLSIPLVSVAEISWDLEAPSISMRDRLPTITLKAAIEGKDQPATINAALQPQIEAFTQSLPTGFKIAAGGSVEETAKGQAPIIAVAPLMLFTMFMLIMVQMQSFRRFFIVLAAAPLAVIGVTAAMLPSGTPLGFVALLGVLALVGILLRNSIILVHEIEEERTRGHSAWEAVFLASDSRARPILLTAAAASLALIPISRQIFWGPMAVAMMGGIIAGTVITLFFIPALYCAVMKVQKDSPVP